MSQPAPRLDDQLCFQLYTASRLVVRSYRPLLKKLDITYPQYLALMVLWEWRDLGMEPTTVRALGDRLHLDSGTLTPLLKRLESKGLLRRTRNPEDERQVLIALTTAGDRLRDQACGVAAQIGQGAQGQEQAVVALREQLRGLVGLLSQ